MQFYGTKSLQPKRKQYQDPMGPGYQANREQFNRSRKQVVGSNPKRFQQATEAFYGVQGAPQAGRAPAPGPRSNLPGNQRRAPEAGGQATQARAVDGYLKSMPLYQNAQKEKQLE